MLGSHSVCLSPFLIHRVIKLSLEQVPYLLGGDFNRHLVHFVCRDGFNRVVSNASRPGKLPGPCCPARCLDRPTPTRGWWVHRQVATWLFRTVQVLLRVFAERQYAISYLAVLVSNMSIAAILRCLCGFISPGMVQKV